MKAQEFIDELKKVVGERNALGQEYTWDQLVADATEIGLEAGEEPGENEYDRSRKTAVKEAEDAEKEGGAD